MAEEAKSQEDKRIEKELKDELLDELKQKFADAVLEAKVQRERKLAASVKKEKLLEICSYLRGAGFDHLSCVSSADYADRLEAVYMLWSNEKRKQLILKVPLPKDSPSVDSVTSIWRGADWHEREAFDLMGIKFEGHPNLVRILLPDEFVGYPLRKDFTTKESPWYENKPTPQIPNWLGSKRLGTAGSEEK